MKSLVYLLVSTPTQDIDLILAQKITWGKSIQPQNYKVFCCWEILEMIKFDSHQQLLKLDQQVLRYKIIKV